MGLDRAAASESEDQRTAAGLAVARDRQRDLLRNVLGLPLATSSLGFPPWSTVYRWFSAWRDACVFEKLDHALVMADRERSGREPSPSAAVIDSQSIKTTEAGGPRGYDTGKKIKGRKRHALVDTNGRALLLEPHSGGLPDFKLEREDREELENDQAR